jgi:hypothetical protein
MKESKPLPFRGGVGVGLLEPHMADRLCPTPVPSPDGEG